MIKNLLRRWSLRKSASSEPTGLLPLQAVRSAVAFISVEEQDFEACKNDILAFYRTHNIKGSVFFFDFRRIEKGERLITGITTTVLRKDLNWYGQPSPEKTRTMLEGEPDLFISLLPANSYPLEYMARCSKARFKVGRQQLPGNVFDLVVLNPTDKKLSQREALGGIIKLLETVK